MRAQAFLATGLAASSLVGCGSGDSHHEGPEQKGLDPTVQHGINVAAQKGASQLVAETVEAIPELRRDHQRLDNLRNLVRGFTIKKNYDGQGYTLFDTSRDIGGYGEDSEQSTYAITTQYRDNNPGQVRRLKIYHDNLFYKSNGEGVLLKDKSNQPVIDYTENTTVTFAKGSNGDWKVHKAVTDTEPGGLVSDNDARNAHMVEDYTRDIAPAVNALTGHTSARP